MATETAKAQVLLGNQICALCDTYKEVKWKCQNCCDILCKQCKNIHLRSKPSKHHIVSELVHTSEENPTSTTSIFCPDHVTETFHMYCTTCKCLICLDCITSKHKQHEYTKLGDITKQKRIQIEAALDQIKNKDIPKLEQTIKTTTMRQTDYNSETDKLMTEIKTKGEEMKQKIDEIQNKLIHDLMTQATNDQQQLKKSMEQMHTELNLLKTTVEENERMVQKFSDIDIIVKTDNIIDCLSQLRSQPTSPTVRPPRFQTIQLREEDLKLIYGQLDLKLAQDSGKDEGSLLDSACKLDEKQNSTRVPNASDHLRDKNIMQGSETQKEKTMKENVMSFLTIKKPLNKVNMLNQNEVWVADKTGTQYLVNENGKIIKRKKTRLSLFDAATTNSGDLLETEA